MAILNPVSLFQDAGVLDLRDGSSGGSISGWQAIAGTLYTQGPQSMSSPATWQDLRPQVWVRSQGNVGVNITGLAQDGDRYRYRFYGTITADPNIVYVRVADVFIYREDFQESDGLYYFESEFSQDTSEYQFVDALNFNPNPSFSIRHDLGVASLEVAVTIEIETSTPPPPVYRYYAYWSGYSLQEGESCDYDLTIDSLQVTSARVEIYRERLGEFYKEGICVADQIVKPMGVVPDLTVQLAPEDYSFVGHEWGSWEMDNLYIPDANRGDAVIVILDVEVETDRGTYNTEMKALLGPGE